jgi:hypothetical protein
MSAGTVIADPGETVAEPPEPSRPRRVRLPRRRVPTYFQGLLGRDIFGVRLGVLLLIMPLMLATLGLMLTSRQGWNHPPDSRYYLTMMARDMGYSWPHAIHAEQQISPSTHLAPWYFADNDPTWQMVRTRLLYPVLSIPFIHLWGLSGGSMAIPVLGTVLFLWATARVLQRLYGPAIAVIIGGAFGVAATTTEFAWAGTDTLAMGLAAVIVANLPIERRIGKANLVWLGAASVFIALTRQVGVLAPAMAGAGWLWALARERTWRNRWFGSLVVTSGVTLVIQALTMMLVKTDTAGIISRGQTTYWGIIRQFVHYLRIVTIEACTYMWQNDRLLYAIFIAAGFCVLAQFASDAAALFFGAACSAYLISAGLGFSAYMRYEMIIFPAAAVAAGQVVRMLIGDQLRIPAPAVDTAAVQAVERPTIKMSAVNMAAADANTAELATADIKATDIKATDPVVTALTAEEIAAADVAAEIAADMAADAAAAQAPLPTRSRRRSFGVTNTLAATKPGRFLGLHEAREDRWKPQLILNAAVLAVVVGISLHGSWTSTTAAPASPAFAAAQGGSGYAVRPVYKQPAEQTLKVLFDQGVGLAHDSGQLQQAVDWVHTLRYRPLTPEQPGWANRDKDGTAIVYPNSMGEDRTMQEEFGRGLTLNLTVKSNTVKILSRQVSEYGEDVVFTVEDTTGTVHRGTATTLYAVWSRREPAIVTSMVFDV